VQRKRIISRKKRIRLQTINPHMVSKHITRPCSKCGVSVLTATLKGTNMSTIDLAVHREVERLFIENPPHHGQQCQNPVTGGWYIGGLDPIEPQKEQARRALFAREWFSKHGPADAPPLPLTYCAREALKIGGLPHIVAWYARHWKPETTI
jgi:hypothetical protein